MIMLRIPMSCLVAVLALTLLSVTAAPAATAPICDLIHRIEATPGTYAFFQGPRDTGKTLAAEFLAKRLGMDLYRVDLSLIVSKYIGRTEKNLAELFDTAEDRNRILYIDAADFLFRKRVGTQDANERYGNMEARQLLEQIESHKVPVIFATSREPAAVPRTRKPPVVVYFDDGEADPYAQLKTCR